MAKKNKLPDIKGAQVLVPTNVQEMIALAKNMTSLHQNVKDAETLSYVQYALLSL